MIAALFCLQLRRQIQDTPEAVNIKINNLCSYTLHIHICPYIS